jgi:hypothetical protein
MTLYSYCVRYDTGAAPNPYWGVCTLVICKPAIRRAARLGDWIVGLGPKTSRIGDISGHVVYAMCVTGLMSMKCYDAHCQRDLSGKMPDWASMEYERRVGDCIYDFSGPGEPCLRRGVHGEGNRQVDLGGMNALLSEHFYYFGDKPVPLPEHLRSIAHRTQGHKSRANAQHAEDFVAWVEEKYGQGRNRRYGDPLLMPEIMESQVCSSRDLDEDKDDEIC